MLLPPTRATAEVVPRADGVVAGTACLVEAFAQVDPDVEVELHAADGDEASTTADAGTRRPFNPNIVRRRHPRHAEARLHRRAAHIAR